ncbi:NfeD family protein [Methylomarinovum caldicuralii]|uniref:NfeD family protein n=1 Tax=Methylomarinovum caldicuralii TaxID=438856 RepID=UPI002952B4D7|nr:NfeD family protein [Methylomarinovum caldicuralii]
MRVLALAVSVFCVLLALFVFLRKARTVLGRRTSHAEKMVGAVGFALQPITPGKKGDIRIREFVWLASSDFTISKGEPVRVLGALDEKCLAIVPAGLQIGDENEEKTLLNPPRRSAPR